MILSQYSPKQILLFTPVSKMFRHITEMDVMASGLRMLFNCGANISISSRLVFSPSRFPIPFTLPNIFEWPCSAGHFVHNAFQLFFCQLVFGFLQNISQFFQWFQWFSQNLSKSVKCVPTPLSRMESTQ